QPRQPCLGPAQLGFLLDEALLDPGLAVAKRRDLRGELLDLVGIALQRGAQRGLPGAILRQLAALGGKLRRTVLRRRAAGEAAEHHHDEKRRARNGGCTALQGWGYQLDRRATKYLQATALQAFPYIPASSIAGKSRVLRLAPRPEGKPIAERLRSIRHRPYPCPVSL